jgi:DNA-binding PadR family transcriptional regulator
LARVEDRGGDVGSSSLTPLSMAILLSLAERDLHGYALLQEVERLTEGALKPGTGSLYTALQRLMDEGLLVESPDLPASDEDQRRRYYRITSPGRDAVRAEAARLTRLLRVARERDLAGPVGRKGAERA